jgi:hypothetical protein
VNAMRQYRKKEKMFPKNSLSFDIDDFRSKKWMSIEITGCFVAGSKSLQDQLVSRTKKKNVLKIEMKRNRFYYV